MAALGHVRSHVVRVADEGVAVVAAGFLLALPALLRSPSRLRAV